jgi:alpha-N-arabinofuranosidase
VAIASPENKNSWECAFSEAAFMTGMERNAEVVHLTSYAPLFAHEEGWQWTPDMIWFNNLESFGTPNYYVQKLFANNKGTDLLAITKDGKPLVSANGVPSSATGIGEDPVVSIQMLRISEGSTLLFSTTYFIVVSNPSI